MSRRTPRSYHVRMTLGEGGLWSAAVEELPGVRPAPHRSLSRLETRVRDEIASAEGIPEDVLSLVITTSTGDPDLDRQAAHVRTLRARADQLAEEARTAAEEARKAAQPVARLLVRQRGVSVRDAGAVLGGYSGSVISGMTQNA